VQRWVELNTAQLVVPLRGNPLRGALGATRGGATPRLVLPAILGLRLVMKPEVK
jgi:hypothetical protein